MIILFDGPDDSGKTTLIQSSPFEYQMIHFSKAKDQTMEQLYQEKIKEIKALKEKKINVFLDRGFISNYVYSAIFKDSDIISDDTLKEFNDLLDMIVMCLPLDKEKYIKDFYKHKEDKKEMYNDMDEIYELYFKVVTTSVLIEKFLNKKWWIYDKYLYINRPKDAWNVINNYVKGGGII